MNSSLCSVLLVSALAAAAPTPQAPAPLRDRSSEGLALGGLDPVSYFAAGGGQPKPGEARYEFQWDGVRYRFSRAEHSNWFQAEPQRYSPAFGGFDAAAMARGELRSADPKLFRLQGARLFLFAEPADLAAFDAAAISSADAAWKLKSGEGPRGAPVSDLGLGTPWNLGKQQLAIEGYDPVGYFPEGGGAPSRGDAKIEALLEGARYRFASEAHRAWFLAEPDRYRPKYGGWCAYAMAEGDEVEIDPRSFLIENGRLLLFYKGFLADTRAKWLPKSAALGPKADAQWAKRKPAAK